MRTINAGIIGTGFIGPLHIEAARRLGFVNIVAIVSSQIEKARAKAEMYSVPKYYDNYKKLLADPEIEVVHICTPNHLHFMMAKDALNAGKHVLCEKPLALSVAESKELVELAKEKGLVTGMNFNNRYYPLTYEVMDMIRNGSLGRILAINGAVQQDWLFKDTDYSWRLEPKFTGGSRAVSDVGSHWFDLIEHMTGDKVSSVCSDFGIFYKTRKKPLLKIETYSGKIQKTAEFEEVPVATEDYAGVMFRMESGAKGLFQANQVAAGRKYRVSFEINGTKCSVAWDSENPNQLWIGKREGNNEIMIKDPSLLGDAARPLANCPGGHTEGFPDSIKQVMKNFYTYILHGGLKSGLPVDFPTFESGLREQEICEGIVKSSKAGAWVALGN